MKLHRVAYLSAIASFIIGTIFMVLFFTTCSIKIALAAYYYTLIAGVVNFALFILLLLASLSNNKLKKKYFKGSIALFSNIPVVLIYIYFINILSDTIRVEFVNVSDQVVENLKISGCENMLISKIDQKESDTRWIMVKKTCHIKIDYELDGIQYSENILENVSPRMGRKLSYAVGLPKKD
ncbi:hypothetical protein [Aureivirga sp. CE67]|uniref:hypothetical protein n=1 Tax=Aureivirga sp. CE67 TaxID=1788983 RepID=UPI0018CB7D5B|nr:hypothetical protein [Aureivirga sp. CE67]